MRPDRHASPAAAHFPAAPVRPVALAVTFLLAAGCGGEDAGAPWCDSAAGGEVAANPGPGVWEERGLRPRLEELWRAGGLEEGQGMVLPVGLAAGPSQRVAVPDFRLGEVLVVGPDGSWRGSWTRQGEGPGEVLRPVAATWTEDGRLVVFDVEGAKVVWMDSAGAASEEVQLDPLFTGPVVASGSLAWAGVAPDGTAYLRPGPRPLPGGSRALEVVTRFGPDAAQADTVVRDTVPVLAAEGRVPGIVLPGAPRPRVALAPGGQLLRSDPRGVYRLHRVAPGVDTTPFLCRAVRPHPLTAEERGEGSYPDGRAALAGAVREAPRPSRLAAFGRFFVGASGRVWVQRDRGSPADPGGFWGAAGAEHDVFDAEGRFLGTVRAPEGARLLDAAGDTAFAILFGELNEASIVAYELRLER